ncbi:hypothetical protein [Streptomyces vinaceus]|uniref:hypothetical protein n=1 Tax=Streptomyces vinaceus TaxID=1960 RepID=UPI003825D7E2
MRTPPREHLGIGTTGPGAMGEFTTVVCDADLGRWGARQPAGVHFTAHGSFGPVHPEGGWLWFGPTPADGARTDWSGLVSRALGPRARPRAHVRRVRHRVAQASVAERFRSGRVLLAASARAERCSSAPTATSTPAGATPRRTGPPSATPSPPSPVRHRPAYPPLLLESPDQRPGRTGRSPPATKPSAGKLLMPQ